MASGLFSSSGSTKRTQSFLTKMSSPQNFTADLSALAQQGVEALRATTPVESGLTASSWGYEIVTKNGKTTIYWTNTHSVNGVNIAIILQYGHGTGTGGYIAGRDYINPAIAPIFDAISDEVWKKVTQA